MILSDLMHAAALLFIVFDPFASLPIFIGITMKFDDVAKTKSANNAVFVALILFLIFTLIGDQLLALFGITTAGFRIAGGLVLLLMALEIIFGLNLVRSNGQNVAWVIVATPILTGPGVLTTAILLTYKYGYLTTILAGSFALFITWVLLRNAVWIVKIVGANVIEISSKIIGLLLGAMAVEYIMRGSIEFIQNFGAAVLR